MGRESETSTGPDREHQAGPSKAIQIRVEAFNALDHPQFYGAGSVHLNVASQTFGDIVAAASPRLVPPAARFTC